jgi:hypothetical protein
MVAYVYVRPHEFVPALANLTFPMMMMVALFGYVLDVRLGASARPRANRLTLAGLAFFAWMLLSAAVRGQEELSSSIYYLVPPACVFYALSQGVRTLRGYWALGRILVAVTLLLTGVAVHMGFTPKVCIADGTDTAPDSGSHTCNMRADCADIGTPGQDWNCEHLGLFRTVSDGGRVRYRGVFQDPNQLAWAMNMCFPFAFGWFAQRRTSDRRLGPTVMMAVVVVACLIGNVMTRSRSGQISLVATLAVYFIPALGWRGLTLGGVVALPVMLLGGRSDESSTQERLECWAEALGLWRENPFIGVGANQFTKHHYLTAHNSFLLALAEMGPIGLVLWTLVLYLAFKIAIQIRRDFKDRPEARSARIAALTLLAGLVGTTVSAFFLSLTYHLGFWIEIGFAAALAAAVQHHDPDWRLRWSRADWFAIIGLDVATVSAIALYLKLKGL